MANVADVAPVAGQVEPPARRSVRGMVAQTEVDLRLFGMLIALAAILPGALSELAATGFRDTTRLAASDPRLWTAICSHNREYLLKALARFEEKLEEFRRALEGDDAGRLLELLEEGRRSRSEVLPY